MTLERYDEINHQQTSAEVRYTWYCLYLVFIRVICYRTTIRLYDQQYYYDHIMNITNG